VPQLAASIHVLPTLLIQKIYITYLSAVLRDLRVLRAFVVRSRSACGAWCDLKPVSDTPIQVSQRSES
jgi:hypothetical protein